MKLAFEKQIPHVHIECDNIVAYDLLVDNDVEELEEEGLLVPAQQINLLYAEFNKPRTADLQRSCKLYSVFATRNAAPAYVAEFGLNHCSSLVEIPEPFSRLQEILDMDIGLGPHLDAFEVQPNFGLGEEVHNHLSPAPPVSQHMGFFPMDLAVANFIPTIDHAWVEHAEAVPDFGFNAGLNMNMDFETSIFAPAVSSPSLLLWDSFMIPLPRLDGRRDRGIIIQDTPHIPIYVTVTSQPAATDKGKNPVIESMANNGSLGMSQCSSSGIDLNNNPTSLSLCKSFEIGESSYANASHV